MNWILRVYDDNNKQIDSVEFFATTEITANKIALNIVEKEFVGKDWTLMRDVNLDFL